MSQPEIDGLLADLRHYKQVKAAFDKEVAQANLSPEQKSEVIFRFYTHPACVTFRNWLNKASTGTFSPADEADFRRIHLAEIWGIS